MMNRLSRVVAPLLFVLVGVGLVTQGRAADEATSAADAGKLSKAELQQLLDDAASGKGFEPLFKEDLSNANCPPNSWAFEDGVLTPKGKIDIWTKEKYGDFVLDLEFKCAEKSNSGILLRCKDVKQWLHTSIEIQILQNQEKSDKNSCGSVYDCQAPTKQMIKKAGEWNRYIIICKANRIYVVLNGEQVVDMDLNQWTEAHKNPDGSKNKFNNAYKDMAREGFIGLQYHGSPIWFRNLKIKPLS